MLGCLYGCRWFYLLILRLLYEAHKSFIFVITYTLIRLTIAAPSVEGVNTACTTKESWKVTFLFILLS